MHTAMKWALLEAKDVQRTVQALKNQQMPLGIMGICDQAKEYFLELLCETCGRHVLYVLENNYSAKNAFLRSNVENKVYLPEPDAPLGLIDAVEQTVAQERIGALASLKGKKSVIYTTIGALLYKMTSPLDFYDSFIKVQVGEEYRRDQLIQTLVNSGYVREAAIEKRGEFALKGEVLEIFPVDREFPLRIVFFDDEIESIKRFDMGDKKTFGKPLKEVEIVPAWEISLSEQGKEALKAYFISEQSMMPRACERYLDMLEQGEPLPNLYSFMSILGTNNLLDYVPDGLVVFDNLYNRLKDHAKLQEENQRILADLLLDELAFDCQDQNHFDPEHMLRAWRKHLVDLCYVDTMPSFLKPYAMEEVSIKALDYGKTSLELLIQSASQRVQNGHKVLLFAGSRATQVRENCEKQGVAAAVTNGSEYLPGKINIVNGYLPYGFEVASGNTLLVGQKELFHTIKEKKAKEEKKKQTEDLFSSLHVGDIVVHDIHGKGRYLGIKTMEVSGVYSDYLELEYKDGDKLYVQSSQIDRVQKYIGNEEDTVALSKLGGKEWENTKSKVRESVKQLAFDLHELYQKRAAMEGYAYQEDTVWQRQFEDSFEYEETQGQMESAEQIKRDMESPRIMDRILLGDVGYGKTEVAMRAAFKAVMDSKQVAILVPTTLLARQHYMTFQQRMEGYPVTIGLLSRFQSHENKKTIQKIKEGNIDIVIGTHRLLGNDVIFKDLGLLVVDEEQRFGVAHKEKIKNLKNTVDVLTMSATPIPRTLEMAMVGMRDMSTIDTPPEDRKEVSSVVVEFSETYIKEAITRELARDGQVYFVVRKINQMDEVLAMLRKLAPKAKICMAHGRLSEREFEQTIGDFYEQKYDIMLCTTIIESGIDIPNVNTIIVYEADKFGLAQLYQLKGRVGRSSRKAYAYFTYFKQDSLSEIAQKRLSAMREFTQLGSGFKIAMRDLQIRGAGNILGPEQSGHLAQVGYHMYCDMVRQEVSKVMGEPAEKVNETAVELSISAYIPKSYIPSEMEKLEIYRKIGSISSVEEAKDVKRQLQDRFHDVPREVENLMITSMIRAYAFRAGIASVIKKGNKIEMKYMDDTQLDMKKLMKLISIDEQPCLFRATTPPMLVYDLKRAKKSSLMALVELLNKLRRCIVF